MLTEAKDTKWSENNPELIREFESKLCVLSKQKEKKKKPNSRLMAGSGMSWKFRGRIQVTCQWFHWLALALIISRAKPGTPTTKHPNLLGF